jgi:hypothetical protein
MHRPTASWACLLAESLRLNPVRHVEPRLARGEHLITQLDLKEFLQQIPIHGLLENQHDTRLPNLIGQ